MGVSAAPRLATGTAVHERATSELRPRIQLRTHRLRGSARLLSALVAAVGTAVLVGWAFDLSVLIRIVPRMAAMKANTALCVTSLGAALLCANAARPRRWQRASALGLSALVIALILITGLQMLLGVDLGIDQLLVREHGHSAGRFPGRMSPVAAVLLVISALGVLALDRKLEPWGPHVAQIAGMAGGLGALLALLGYLYNTHTLYQFGPYTSVAFHTALALALVSLALLCSRPEHGVMALIAGDSAAGFMMRRILPFALVTPIALGWLLLQGQYLGLYGTEVGLAIYALTNVVCSSVVIRWTAAELQRVEQERARTLAALATSEQIRAADAWARQRAELALRDTELQLNQAQKMEAIGKLAGGVAHDFNNLLSVVLGYAELVIARTQSPELRADLMEIRRAGTRAADLTQQLLAFSRRQLLEPRIVDLNESVNQVHRMVRRIIGEDVTVEASTAPRLWRVKVDPGQIAQILMNLVVNARDAMPHGGTMRFETRNVDVDPEYAAQQLGVSPGPHVLLALADTGTGMPPEVIARIFEPFYTTKAPGKGTGLGLSTVFGIVKQSGGHIDVASAPGQGTVFRIYFPRADGEALPSESARPDTAASGHETIVLVEDDAAVRGVARRVLTSQGYRVLEASSPEDALGLCKGGDPAVDLLLTDVVMPECNGRELVDRVRPFCPTIKVLLMSGYADSALGDLGALGPGTAFLQKPITPEALGRKVREVLDAQSQRS